jgi:multisubunit Na+/H+ antiporter MnhE subunit
MGVRALVEAGLRPVTLSGAGQASSWSDWVHVNAIQALFHHTSAVIAALIVSAVLGYLVQRLLHDGPVKRAILMLDELMVFCLFLYFAYELLTSL